MSILIPNPKELEREEDKVIAQHFVASIEKEMKDNTPEDLVKNIQKTVKDLVKEHPYLVGIMIGILLTKYTDIEKNL